MIYNTFFILSFLFLLFGIVFVYKVPEKVSLLRSLVICFITELCFGAIVTGIYAIIGIPVYLMNLGIAYLVLGLAVWGIIFFQKKMQKLKILKEDIYVFFAITVWFIIIFMKVFSPSIINVYSNSDPAVHYQMALNVMNTGKVSAMYFAEVYNAGIMELLAPFLTRLSLYKAFILADSFANLLNVFMFYCLITTFFKLRFSKIITPFLSFLYFAGWPFFSYVIGGFVYFGWGVTLFAYVVYLLIKLYESRDKRNQIALLGLVLVGCFSVLVCYLLFAVILAGIVLLSLMCIARKNGFVDLKKNIMKIGIVVLLMAIAIFAFCFWGYFKGDLSFVISALKRDGGIAKELYQDFVFLMPAVFYMGWKYIKNKEDNLLFISVSVILAYIICTFIMCLLGIMSSYYYYKSYYLLWFFAWIINIAFIEYLFEKDRVMLFSCGGTLLFAILITLSGTDTRLAKKDIVIDEVSSRLYPSPFPIWDRMEIFFVQEQYLADRDALIQLSEFMYETFPEQEEIPMILNIYWMTEWYNSYTANHSVYKAIISRKDYVKAIQEYKEAGSNYIVIYQNSELYRDNIELLSDYENIFSNGYYGIYKLQ